MARSHKYIKGISGTLHTTKKAFERYLQANIKDSKLLYVTATKMKRFTGKNSLGRKNTS